VGYVPVVARGLRSVLDAFGRKLSSSPTGFDLVLPPEPRFVQAESVTSMTDATPDSVFGPAVLDVTPPDGETHVDTSVDWESPDNEFLTPLDRRAPLRVRLRFQHPLDPRTVNATTFRMALIERNSDTEQAQSVFEPVTIESVVLRQSRRGDVTVEVTPAGILESGALYSVVALGTVRGLNGELLGADHESSFKTAH
jgi:hypothetical protein